MEVKRKVPTNQLSTEEILKSDIYAPDCANQDDETVQERVIGLTEMIPKCIRQPIGKLGRCLWSVYQTVCGGSWVVFTTVAIIFGPVVFETERQRLDLPSCQSKPTGTSAGHDTPN